MYFVGLDLAWSPRNNSAVSIIEGGCKSGRIVDFNSSLGSNEEIVKYVCSFVGKKPALVAIDAPLVVPNETGMRPADKLTTRLFRPYDAGTHPANREHLSKFGGLRGEELTEMFEKRRFSHQPEIKPKKETRTVFEVYPHPAIVVLFNLRKILKYKPRGSRNYEYRWTEFKKFQKLLKSLENKVPSLEIPQKLIKKDITKLKASSLKEYEDFLDSIICAYIAHYYWVWGKEKCAVLGTLGDGYIVTPVFDHMKKELNQKQMKLEF